MMNRRVLSDVLSGVLGSIVLGMLLIFVSNLPFTEANNMLLPLIILGSIIVAIVILFRNYSFKHAILRTILMFMCCFVAIRLFAVTGIVEFIENTLLHIHIQENDANDRAAGTAMGGYLWILFRESIIINVILLVRSLIKRRKGDGSLS